MLVHEREIALWRNVGRGGRYLSRRVQGAGLEVGWEGTDLTRVVRRGQPTARLRGTPGELLLFLFGRQAVAEVEVTGPADAVAAVKSARFGM